MESEIISWLSHPLQELRGNLLFEKYFNNISPMDIEKTFYLSNQNLGIAAILNEDLQLSTVNFFSEGFQNNKEFKGVIIQGIDFSSSRKFVRTLLGKPNRIGGGHHDFLIGFIPPWDKFYRERHSVHFQYSNSETKIDMISIATLQLETELNSKWQ